MNMLLLVAALACSEPTAPVTADPVAIDTVVEALEEVPIHYARGHDDAARQSWRVAHAAFDEGVEPALRTQWGRQRTAELEYLFGRLRHELDATSGDPAPLTKDLLSRLGDVPRQTPPPPVQ